MEEQIERLKRKVRQLTTRLQEIEDQLLRVAVRQGECLTDSVEYARLALEEASLTAESAAVQADLVAAELRIAHLKVAVEVERLRQKPDVTADELEQHHARLEKVSNRHRRSAKRKIRQATNEDATMARVNGELVANQGRRREVEYDEPGHEYDGPSM